MESNIQITVQEQDQQTQDQDQQEQEQEQDQQTQDQDQQTQDQDQQEQEQEQEQQTQDQDQQTQEQDQQTQEQQPQEQEQQTQEQQTQDDEDEEEDEYIDDSFIYKLQEVTERFAYVSCKIEQMDKKMDKILEILSVDCKKMSNHIDFVENIYDKVKKPFNYVMDRVSNFIAPTIEPWNSLDN